MKNVPVKVKKQNKQKNQIKLFTFFELIATVASLDW